MPENHGTSHLANSALEAIPDSQPIVCTIDRHCRTRIFDYPGVCSDRHLRHEIVYESNGIRASLATDLIAYFKNSDSIHYAKAPSLRHAVSSLCERKTAHEVERNPCLIVEQLNAVPPVTIGKGCALVPEVTYEDGERKPRLEGGRDNRDFIMALQTDGGPWPDIPYNEPIVNTILAAARATQDEVGHMPKQLDRECFLTTDGQFVAPSGLRIHPGRLTYATPLDDEALREHAATLRATIGRMASDLETEHIRLLVSAVYWDDHKDNDFRRLHYLRLWQSLNECRRKLGYQGKINDNATIAGASSLAALTSYRNDIAHWWTGKLDENRLADLYRTINALIRRKYARSEEGERDGKAGPPPASKG